MGRYQFLFVIGGLCITAGQVWLSLILHPDSAASPLHILYSAAAVAAGCAISGTGMLGMADTYQTTAVHTERLLDSREPPAAPPPVATMDHLRDHNVRFWRSYVLSSVSISLFLVGVLAVSLAFSRNSYLLYLAGLGGGVAVLGLLTLMMGGRALLHMRREHADVAASALQLEQQPERPATPDRSPPSRRKPRGAGQPSGRHRSNPTIVR